MYCCPTEQSPYHCTLRFSPEHFHFQRNFRTGMTNSIKNPVGILIGINLEKIDSIIIILACLKGHSVRYVLCEDALHA